ncbi:unnamed protein product [Calypogeia fissa]
MVCAAAPSGGGGGEDGSLLPLRLAQMMEAVEVLLQGIGEDVQREGLRKTPLRVASAFQGALAGYQLSAKEIIGPALFTEVGAGGETGCGGGSGGIVVVSNMDSFAVCESCFLPFRLRCHVVYVSCGERVVGLSKFPRVAEMFAKRLQNPQQFADQLVEALNNSFGPLGVGVVVETWHLRWPSVCAESWKASPRTDGGLCSEERLGFGWIPLTVFAGKGQFENFNCSLWDEFLTILQLEDLDLERASLDGANQRKSWCPFLIYDGQGLTSSLGNYNFTVPAVSCNGSSGRGNALPTASELASATAMARGVESLLRGMAVDFSKDELRCTAVRYVQWILAATHGSRGSPSLSQHGQDGHGLTGCHANGTVQSNRNAFLSNGTGSLSNGNGSLSNGVLGPENVGLKGSNVNGCCAIQSNGTTRSMGTLSNWNTHLSDGILSNHHHHSDVGSGSISEHPRISNGGVRYRNGTTLSDTNGTMSNGGSVSRMEVTAGVDNFSSEGVLCLELDISFASLCEHHLLPFLGIVHVGYIRAKGSRPIDRSLVLKIVALYSGRLQVQERLTRQIVEAVVSFAGLQGAMVVVEASHMCIMSRGVEKAASTTATVATIGKFSTDSAIRAAFLKRLPRKGAKKFLGH